MSLLAGMDRTPFYLNAFLGPLSAMHHGSEGERGDETTQEVLNTHAQDCHTWESTHTQVKWIKTSLDASESNYNKTTENPAVPFLKAGRKLAALHVVFSATLLTLQFYVKVKAARNGNLLKCSSPPSVPVPKTHVVYPLRGSGRAVLVGKQRNHRAYLSLLPLTLNYSLKPPEFLPSKTLQSAT